MGTKPSAFTVVTSLAGDEGIPVITDLDGTPGNGIADLQLVSSWGLIAESVLGSSAASVSFTSIPSTFRSLFVVAQTRFDVAITSDGLFMRFNNDTAANYDWELLEAINTTLAGLGSAGASSIRIGNVTGTSSPTGSASVTQVLVPNYAATTFHKNAMCDNAFSQADTAAGQRIEKFSGRWRSTSAINRLDLFPASGNFITGSTFTLYGLRGA